MEEVLPESPAKPAQNLSTNNINKYFLGILVVSVILGTIIGYFMAKGNKSSGLGAAVSSAVVKNPQNPQQDISTFRDFAEGTIQKRPEPKNANEYVEGTHLLVRDGAVPVALTSSVVDLSQYEGKKVKVFGETQKAIKEGWLMDVGKVEVE